jgi:hypothetical protein
MIINPQLNLTGLQYLAWRTSAEAIAGSEYIVSKGDIITAPYRPKIWSEENKWEEMMFYMEGAAGDKYFFDAVLKVEHNLQRRLTKHPIQLGANIADHSFQLPAQLMLEIGVSDSMDCYDKFWDWDGYSKSRSVNAFNVLGQLMKIGQPLTLHTRIFSYENMVIIGLTAPEDYRTKYEARVRVMLEEIMTVEATKTKVSTKEWTTGSTNKGPQDPAPSNINNTVFLRDVQKAIKP